MVQRGRLPRYPSHGSEKMTQLQSKLVFFFGGGSESIFHFHDYEMKSSYNVYIYIP